MKRTGRPPLVLLVLLPLIAAEASAQSKPIPLVGTWQRDAALSTMPGNQPPPKSSLFQVTIDDGKSFSWTETTVAADGKTLIVSYSGAFDGTPRPVQGMKNGAVMSFTRLSSNAYGDDGHDNSGARWSETCALTQDAKILTCTGTDTDAGGKPNEYRDVWRRGQG